MTFGSLFAGIGGFDLGLERAGMKPKWQVEYDDYCSRVLAKHWPRVRRFKDIRHVDPADLAPVDVVCGGFPCQPASVAGKRRGQEDDRWLWPEMLRIVQAIRPAWVLGENVAGIISLGLDDVLSDLERAGYACQTFIIPACAVDAPHRRDRVWVVAHAQSRKDHGRESRVVAETQGCREGFDATSYACRQDVAHANSERQPQPQGRESKQRGWSGNGGEDVPDANGQGLEKRQGKPGDNGTQRQAIERGCRWEPEPRVGRVASRVSRRVDRLRALGNSVVPAVVERIGRAIMEASQCAKQ